MKNTSPVSDVTGWHEGEGRGEERWRKRRRQGGKNMRQSLLAGIKGCAV